MRIIYSPKSLKQLRRLIKFERVRVVRRIEGIESDPYVGKKFKGVLEGLYSVRSWPFRIIYRITKKEIQIVSVEHRQAVYK